MTENLPAPAADDSGEFILYQTEDGQTRIEVRLSHETIWLPQRLIATLFQVSVPTVNEHLK
ncbi:MAG: hydroxyacid dehydrogenase, partial [Planctomyces sp.]